MKLAIPWVLFFSLAATVNAQTPQAKFIADTLVVQADGTSSCPHLATMTFHIFAQDKELKKAYDQADAVHRADCVACGMPD